MKIPCAMRTRKSTRGHRKIKQFVLIGSVLAALNTVSAQPAVEVTKPQVCAATQVAECITTGACVQATPETFNLPVLIRLDISNEVAESMRTVRAIALSEDTT